MRFFIELAYLGTHFHGWQTQPNAHTVQEDLQSSLATLLQIPVPTTGCGRTDTGVHARSFFAHFDFEMPLPEELVYKLNKLLPKDIVVKRIVEVPGDFHARFSATERTYEYYIHFNKDPFQEGRSLMTPHDLAFDKMNEAAKVLLEYEDFQCFSKSNTQVNNYRCDIKSAYWGILQNDKGWVFSITANRFLRNMVRAIVGTMLDIGRGKISMSEFREIIESKERSRAGTSAAASGLYLTGINYPDSIV